MNLQVKVNLHRENFPLPQSPTSQALFTTIFGYGEGGTPFSLCPLFPSCLSGLAECMCVHLGASVFVLVQPSCITHTLQPGANA